MKVAHLFSAVALTALLSLTIPAIGDVLIDSFERTTPAPWTFYNGAEFPGATGSLTSISTGFLGRGVRLAYDFTGGGQYVSANLTLGTPQTCAAIGFQVKSPANITVVLRVVDSTNQTLQYNLSRPLENRDLATWYRHVVALNSPQGWWGGANDGVVHSPISQIAILAADRVDTGSGYVGSIDIDEVYAISSTAFNLNPAVQPLIPGPPGSANLNNALGVNIHFTTDDTALNAIQSAGFKFVRMDLTWTGVEQTAGVYNWTNYDALVNSAQARGLKVHYILDYGNPIYTGQPDQMYPPVTSSAITAYGNYCEAAARHFAGKGVTFEVWNEPNISGFWLPAPDFSQYASVCSEAIRRVHIGDSTALVSTGGLSGFHFAFLRGYLGLGAGANANAIGMHPYDVGNPPQSLPERLLTAQGIVAQYLSPAPPIWDTEWGFTSTDYGAGNTATARRRQGLLVARKLLSVCAAGFPFSVYYDIRDDGTDPNNREHNFGLLANDYTEKDAMRAVKKLTAMASTHTFAGLIHTEPSSLVAMRFDGPADQVVVLWTYAANGPVTITATGNVTATDFLGATVTPNQDIHETDGPFYYTFSSATPPNAPTNLTASSTIKRKINLAWTQSTTPGITQNKVYRSTTGASGPYTLRATLSPSTSYTDSGLTSGQQYYYVVTAVAGGLESAYSNSAGAVAR